MTKTLTLRASDIPGISHLRKFGVGFDSMLDDMTRLHSNYQETSYPPYNIIQLAPNTFSIELAVAGFGDDDLAVSIENNQLTVVGTQTLTETVDYLHHGISSRGFTRTFPLAEHIVVTGASTKNGMLTIGLEREVPEEKKPRQIEINKK